MAVSVSDVLNNIIVFLVTKTSKEAEPYLSFEFLIQILTMVIVCADPVSIRS